MKWFYLKRVIFLSSFLYVPIGFAQSTIHLPSLSGSAVEVDSLDCRKQVIPDEQGVSLLKAVCVAVQRYPSIASSMAGYAGQVDMVDAAKAGYYPQVSFGMQTTKSTGNTNGYANTPKLSIQQRVYDFGKVSSAVDQSKGSVEKQRGTLLQQVDNVIGQTALAVIEVQRLEALVQKSKGLIVGINKVVDIAQSRANAGISTQSDYIQAKSRLEAAQANLYTTQTQLEAARVRLATYVGRSYKNAQFAPISDRLFNHTLFRFKLDPEQIPSVIMSKADQTIAEAQLKGADADLYPTVSVVGSVEKTVHGNNPNTGKSRGNYNYVGLSVDQTIFSGGERLAKKRSAQKMLNAAGYNIETVMLELNDQAESLRVNILGVESRLSILEERVKSISKTRVLYQEQYTLGSRPILDLLNSEEEMFQAESSLVNTYNDMWSYYTQYLVLTGNARRIFNLNALIQTALVGQNNAK